MMCYVIRDFAGDCITFSRPDNACALNSVATKCNDQFEAMECSCNQGYQPLDELTCVGKTLILIPVLWDMLILHRC